ncbi:hypothetical protein ACFPRL_26415 [Pseudoclavibacter helvolus]
MTSLTSSRVSSSRASCRRSSTRPPILRASFSIRSIAWPTFSGSLRAPIR